MRYLGERVGAGRRVRVVRDPRLNGPWPSEPTGRIADGFSAPFQELDLAQHPDIDVPDEDRHAMRTFMVRFDQPAEDGSGHGPYYMAEVWEKHLRPLP